MNIEELWNADKSATIQPPQSVSPLVSLGNDLKFYSESLKEVAMEIIESGLSSFPVFIAHQHQLNFGELLFDRHELATDWSVHASCLENLVDTKLITEARMEKFKDVYKNPYQFVCVLVVVPEGANFVFFPYSD